MLFRFCATFARAILPSGCFTTLNPILRPTSVGTGRNFSNLKFDVEMERIVWVDLEMTGLDIEKDTILEIACVVTDTDLNVVAEGPNLVIKTSEQKLSEMGEWCVNQHGKTGLTAAAINSNVSLEQAEETIMNFVTKYVTKNASPLAGNSVYMDRLFLRKYMPRLDDYLHYRIIDVSTIKELCRRWNKDTYKSIPKKAFGHRALGDILESVAELKFYKENFFKLQDLSN